MPQLIVKHIDSEILVAAFCPDRRDIRTENDRLCRKFLSRIKDKELNTKIRISLTALGEFVHVYAERGTRVGSDIGEFVSFAKKMKGRFEPYSPKLRGTPEKLFEALKSAGSCCEQGKDSHADALIVATAMVDPEAVSLFTTDRHMLTCPKLGERVREFRESNELRRLRIMQI